MSANTDTIKCMEADIDDPARLDTDGLYWFGEFCRYGMCSPQAVVLASAHTSIGTPSGSSLSAAATLTSPS